MTTYLIKDTMAVYVTWLYVFETNEQDVLEDFKNDNIPCLGHVFGDPVEDGGFGDLEYEEITKAPPEIKQARAKAAGPDLLAALQNVLEIADQTVVTMLRQAEEYDSDDLLQLAKNAQDECEEARATIAKVTNE